MIKEIRYQRRAVDELVEKTLRLLDTSGARKRLVFHAPTGSGKTVMASAALDELTTALKEQGRGMATIWIAPNKLHEQSYFRMRNYFSETRALRPALFDELDHSADGYIRPGEILFVNWESINKEKNLMVRDDEHSQSLFEMTRRTQDEQGTPIVVIIDEEHLFWSKTADKSKAILQKINPKVELRISATPKSSGQESVTVYREDVVKEEMIKKQVILNPDITEGYTDDQQLNEHLIACALRKRQQLADAYRALGVDINPLLLIQLPNDTKETLTTEDTAIRDLVVAYLRDVKDITVENQRLAVWLSGTKDNVEGIEDPHSLTDVLLFKQAIALGWDCPRAAVLLIFRKLNSDAFTIQTVGRILRMPEQHFYTNNALNVGYVYTDLAKDKITIVAEDMDYLNKDAIEALRRENLENVSLASYYRVQRSSDRNRLGPDFRKVLKNTFRDLWQLVEQPSLFSLLELDGEDDGTADTAPADTESIVAKNRRNAHQIRFDVRNINVEIPSDVVFQNEVGIYDAGEKRKFARSAGEVHRIYTEYCRSLLGRFERAHSTGILAAYLLEAMEELFEVFETDAEKVVLYHQNKPHFTEIIEKALGRYEQKLNARQREARERGFEHYQWEVPAERIYKESTHHVDGQVKDHALLPFVELNAASVPEVRFKEYLEAHKDKIDWWYKNGDEGKQHYAVPYENSQGEKSLFYVDFIVRLKSGDIYLFDTKTPESDSEATYKHNALLQYMAESKEKLRGGVLIEQHDVWHYSNYPIENTSDLTGWDTFIL